MSGWASIRDLAAGVDTSALCDVDRDLRVLSPDLRCRSRNPMICGPAMTVHCRDDVFAVLRAIEAAEPGDIVVVDGGGRPAALAGELFARGALARGLGGIVVDGGYRDLAFIASCELPVYSRHVTPMAGTATRPGVLNEPVTCGGVRVNPGDIVIADHDGIVVLDPATAVASLTAAARVKATEARVLDRLDHGDTLGDCFNVDEHALLLAAGEPSTLRVVV